MLTMPIPACIRLSPLFMVKKANTESQNSGYLHARYFKISIQNLHILQLFCVLKTNPLGNLAFHCPWHPAKHTQQTRQ